MNIYKSNSKITLYVNNKIIISRQFNIKCIKKDKLNRVYFYLPVKDCIHLIKYDLEIKKESYNGRNKLNNVDVFLFEVIVDDFNYSEKFFLDDIPYGISHHIDIRHLVVEIFEKIRNIF